MRGSSVQVAGANAGAIGAPWCANRVPIGTGAAGAGARLPCLTASPGPGLQLTLDHLRRDTDTATDVRGTLFSRILEIADMRCNRLSDIAAVVSLAFRWGARNGIASGRRILAYLPRSKSGPAPNGPTLTDFPQPGLSACCHPQHPATPQVPPSATVLAPSRTPTPTPILTARAGRRPGRHPPPSLWRRLIRLDGPPRQL